MTIWMSSYVTTRTFPWRSRKNYGASLASMVLPISASTAWWRTTKAVMGFLAISIAGLTQAQEAPATRTPILHGTTC